MPVLLKQVRVRVYKPPRQLLRKQTDYAVFGQLNKTYYRAKKVMKEAVKPLPKLPFKLMRAGQVKVYAQRRLDRRPVDASVKVVQVYRRQSNVKRHLLRKKQSAWVLLARAWQRLVVRPTCQKGQVLYRLTKAWLLVTKEPVWRKLHP